MLFTVVHRGGGGAGDHIAVQPLKTRERRVLVQGGSQGRYVPTGQLVYARAGTLMAAPFDLGRLELTGASVPIVERVMQSRGAQFNFSRSGSLIYVPGGITTERTLVWVDRKGMAQPLAAPPRDYRAPRLSPDGRRLAVTIVGDEKSAVWVYDLSRETLTRLTSEGEGSNRAIWTPDGKRLTFASGRGGPDEIFWKHGDGSGVEERLIAGDGPLVPHSWSPDGQVLTLSTMHPATRSWDIWVLVREGGKLRPLLQTPFSEGEAVLSPDGRWLAYESNESGLNEVYVQPFPGPGAFDSAQARGKWQISTDGGTEPVWNPNGRELFYRNGAKMMAVDITTHPTFAAGKPRLLFERRYAAVGSLITNYDVTPDGQRFVMVREREQQAAPTQLNVVLDWFDELKRRVPVGTK